MLTPSDIHNIAGILCKLNEEGPHESILSEEVYDKSIDDTREVDIVIKRSGTVKAVYKGYEVKHKSRPLDVVEVEQLCIKFNDMPSLQMRGIISASGFTKAAVKKAKYHNVELFEFVDWKEFRPTFGNIIFWNADMNMHEPIIDWVPTGTANISFQNAAHTLVKPEEVSKHPVFAQNGQKIAETFDDLLLDIGEHLRHSVKEGVMQHNQLYTTLIPVNWDNALNGAIYISVNGVKAWIGRLTINGVLSMEVKEHKVFYKALLKQGETNPLKVVCLSDTSPGHLIGLTYDEKGKKHMLISVMKEYRDEKVVERRILS